MTQTTVTVSLRKTDYDMLQLLRPEVFADETPQEVFDYSSISGTVDLIFDDVDYAEMDLYPTLKGLGISFDAEWDWDPELGRCIAYRHFPCGANKTYYRRETDGFISPDDLRKERARGEAFVDKLLIDAEGECPIPLGEMLPTEDEEGAYQWPLF